MNQVNNDNLIETYEHKSYFTPAQSMTLLGRILCIQASLVFILYGTISLTTDIRMGFYTFKIAVIISTALLLLSPSTYPFLLGLLVPVYYFLKARQYINDDDNFTAQYSCVMVIIMTLIYGFTKYVGIERRNNYQFINICSISLFVLFLFSLLGKLVIINEYTYTRRLIEITAFCCAYNLGRSFTNVLPTLKSLTLGLAIGIFPFELPGSIGYILQQGISVLGRLDKFRDEMGVGGVGLGSESGTLLVIFVLTYSLSSSFFSKDFRLRSFWLTAIPSGIIILLYLSKGAVILIPVTLFLNFIFAGKRKAAFTVGLMSFIMAFLLYLKFPEMFTSFSERMQQVGHVASLRENIRLFAIDLALRNPLLGLGPGQFQLHSHFVSSHNEPLNIFVEGGLFSLLSYLTFIAYTVYLAIRLRLSPYAQYRSMGGVFLCLMIAYVIYTQIQPMYFNRGGFLFTFTCGLLTTCYYQNRHMVSVDSDTMSRES